MATSELFRHLCGTVRVMLQGRGQHVEVSGHGGKVQGKLSINHLEVKGLTLVDLGEVLDGAEEAEL